MKLTKVQREFFDNFARNAVVGTLAPILDYKGIEISQEQLSEAVATVDVTELRDAIAEKFLEKVDFKSLQKVDKFMKTQEFLDVVSASTVVHAAVQVELLNVIAPLIPQEEA